MTELQRCKIISELLRKFKNRIKNVDVFSKKYPGAVATLFVHIDNDFVRISTTQRDVDGNRAVWTRLDPSGPAYKALIEGKSFCGEEELFCKKYFTKYEPDFTDKEKCVVTAVFVGIPLKPKHECKCKKSKPCCHDNKI
jgi:methyl-accepting chemotaxis protein